MRLEPFFFFYIKYVFTQRKLAAYNLCPSRFTTMGRDHAA